MLSTKLTRLTTVIAVLSSFTVSAQEWTRFRGPNGSGIAQSTLNLKGLSKESIVWASDLPGKGHSCPVLWGSRIFLTAMDERNTISAFAVDASNGRTIWNRTFPYKTFKKHNFNSFASPTAVVDAERVYLSWSTPNQYTLMALDHGGNTVWTRDLGRFESSHGVGASPILFEDMLILPNDQNGDGFLLAVSRETGETRWQIRRAGSEKTAYSTPCVYTTPQGQQQLIFCSSGHGFTAVDPQKGRVIWEYTAPFDKRTCSSPILTGGNILGSCGSGGGGNYIVAIRPPDGVAQKSPQLAYEIRRAAPYVPCAIQVGQWLYLWSDSGIISCVDPATGDNRWSQRIEGSFGRFFSSPIAVGDQLVCLSDVGEIVVLAATGEFKEIARLALEDTCRATPAVADGHLYVRTESRLFKISGE